MQFSEHLNHSLALGVANFVILNEHVSLGAHRVKAGLDQAPSLNERIVKMFSFSKTSSQTACIVVGKLKFCYLAP